MGRCSGRPAGGCRRWAEGRAPPTAFLRLAAALAAAWPGAIAATALLASSRSAPPAFVRS
jgi:hypothetical protein